MTRPGAADMWDLTIQDDHDFYIEAALAQTAVLVHNCPASEPTRMTTPKATAAAKKLGYTRIRGVDSHGQVVYTNGKNFISPDVDSHSGGAWKMAKSPDDLSSKSTRMEHTTQI